MGNAKESVNKKIIKILALVLVLSVFVMLGVLLFVEEQQKYKNSEEAVNELNDAIIHSVTFSMAEGSTDVSPFSERIKKIENIRDFQVLASDLIRENSNEKMDELETKTLENKKAYFEEEFFKEEDVYRSIRPILADSSCIDCHDQAKVDDVLAIVNMRYSISATKADIMTQRISAFVMASIMIIVIFFLLKNNIKKQIIDDLIKIADHFKVLSTGKLNSKINSERNDEIGDLIHSIDVFQSSLIEKTNTAISISEGNLNIEIPILSQDDSLGISLQKVKDNLTLLTKETEILCNHAVNGELNNRADESKHKGEYSKIVYGINQILDNVTAPLQVAANYIDRISNGDLPDLIKESYKGQFNNIITNINLLIESSNDVSNNIIKLSNGDLNISLKQRSERDILVKSVNILKDNLNQIYSEIFELGQKIKFGSIEVSIDESKYKGAYKDMVEGLKHGFEGIVTILNQMSSNVMISDKNGNISFINNSMKILLEDNSSQFRKVNENVDFADLKGKSISLMHNQSNLKLDILSKLNSSHKVSINIGNKVFNIVINPIKDNLSDINNAYVVEWSDFTDEMNFKNELDKTIKNMNDGLLKERINVSIIGGIYENTSKDINMMLDAILKPLNVAAEYVDRISKGDIPPKINDNYNGDFNEIKNNLNQAIDAISALVRDAKMLAKAAKEGKLDTRADASMHKGDFREVVQGVNNTLDDVIGPLNVAADYVDNISKGNIPEKITKEYFGDFNVIKFNLNTCIDAINLLVSDAKKLANAAKEGKLDTRADASLHQGDFRAIVQGVNDTLDNVIGPLNVAAEYVDRISKGDIPPKINDNYNGDFNEIKNNLNQAIDAISALVRDAKMLAKAAKDGKLSTRADISRHYGDFREVVQGVNNTLDEVIGPLNVAADYVDNISKGNIPEKITKDYFGDFNVIKNNLNTCIDAINLLVSDANKLSIAAKEGKLDTRADASKHFGDFRAIVQGVNDTLDNVIGPLNVAAEYVDRISKGDIPPKINDNYNGDFNEIKNNLNQAIDAISALVRDAKMLAKAAKEGKLSTRADAKLHHGDFREVVQGVNNTLDDVIGPLNVAADYVDKISKGNIPEKITNEYFGDFNVIKNNLNTCIDAINLLVNDAKMLAKAAQDGKLATRADADHHNGEFRAIVEGVNNTLDNVIGPLNVAAEYVDRISKGDIPPKINDNYNGDFNEIKNNLNQAIDAISAMVKDATYLSISAENGDLRARADINKHKGDFQKIIIGVNKTLDSMVAPINEAADILSQMSTGDLTVRMYGDYKGDLAKLKDDINSLGDSLSQLINQVNDSVQNTASAALEISSTAEGLAYSFQEQSSQTDEVASAVEEMSRTVTDNAMSATRTADVANKNGEIAAEGAEIVRQTVSKMRDIANVVENSAKNIQKLGESSKQIGEIISVINEIADQTNLLALNAAIEAARAGEQGRGFAVVADEVRKLAERTSGATKQIANMIKGIQTETDMAVVVMNQGTNEVQKGIEYADRAGESLKEILSSTQELLDMINQIAAASEQQSATSEQIAKNVISISKVTAESNQRIEDVAHTSEDLAKLTEHLRDLMSSFQVDEQGNGTMSNRLSNKQKLIESKTKI